MPYITVEGNTLEPSQKRALIEQLTATASAIMHGAARILPGHHQRAARREHRHRRQAHRRGESGLSSRARERRPAMRAVVQRVSRAQVDIGGQTSDPGRGSCRPSGVGHDDTEAEAERLWSKIARLRIFEDADGKTNLALADVDGEALVVSQFTLYARCKKGNRPSFTDAGAPDEANRLYEWFVQRAVRDVPRVETGRFGAYMDVSLVMNFSASSPAPHRRATTLAVDVQHAYASACSHSGLFETHQHEVLAHHERPLHQHAVLRKQRVRLLVAHARIEERLHVALAVEHAARVEEAPQRQARWPACHAASSSAVGLSSTMWRSAYATPWASSHAFAFLQVEHFGYSTNSTSAMKSPPVNRVGRYTGQTILRTSASLSSSQRNIAWETPFSKS